MTIECSPIDHNYQVLDISTEYDTIVLRLCTKCGKTAKVYKSETFWREIKEPAQELERSS